VKIIDNGLKRSGIQTAAGKTDAPNGNDRFAIFMDITFLIQHIIGIDEILPITDQFVVKLSVIRDAGDIVHHGKVAIVLISRANDILQNLVSRLEQIAAGCHRP